MAFMADYPEDEVRSHRRRFEIYRALAETLGAKFADGASEYKAREDAKGWYAA
jgi:hypothetical protein